MNTVKGPDNLTANLMEASLGNIQLAIKELGLSKKRLNPNKIIDTADALIDAVRFHSLSQYDPRGWRISQRFGFNRFDSLGAEPGDPLLVVGTYMLNGFSGNESVATIELGKVIGPAKAPYSTGEAVLVDTFPILKYGRTVVIAREVFEKVLKTNDFFVQMPTRLEVSRNHPIYNSSSYATRIK